VVDFCGVFLRRDFYSFGEIVMSQLKTPQVFVRRFDAVRARMLQVQMARAVIRSLILLVSGLALLAAMDYLWEVPRIVRQIGLYGLVAGVSAAAIAWIVAAVRRSNRPRTALEIEERFPELGQSVRTAVQFGGRSGAAIAEDGVRSTLVDALEEQVDTETGPLPIEAIVPTRRMKVALAASALLCAALAALCVTDSNWNTAAHRALLEELPYTRMEVSPGTILIEQGRDLMIAIELSGRTNRQVTLFTRQAGDESADWQEQQVVEDDVKPSENGSLRYEIPLTKIKEPFDYRVVAGKLASDEFHVTLKYPLRIDKVEVALTPPEYTRGETTTVVEGNIQALEGTQAAFRFELDRAPVAAKVLLADPRDRLARDADEQPAPEEIPVTIDGNVLTMRLELTQDKVYSLAAISADDMPLPENSFRIRVRKDQPPSVSFDSPHEALEVHTLAEVLMRLRARDDFGLTTAGLVFQVNNEEEHTLLQKDFEEALAEAEQEAADGKRLPPTTQAVLDKLLPLEHFELTQRDSVTYYAFAEDNFPGGARRTESDLRFIDIRPFRRTYKLFDPPDGGVPMGGKPLPLLDELIARQRFALNRTMQLARRMQKALAAGSAGPAAKDDLTVVDNLIEFQQKLAGSTRDLAEALQERNVAGNDLLFQAEESMLAAVDSLTAGKYDNAVLQEKDALHYLIEGRNVLTIATLKKSPKTQAELRAYQRMQMQKLRKPKDEDAAEEIASRLRELADKEEFVYETLTGLQLDEEMPGSGGSGGSGKSKKKPEQPPESKNEPKEVAAADPPEGQTPNDAENPEQSPGSDGKNASGQKGQDASQNDKPADDTADDEPGEKPDAARSRAELVETQADIAAEAAGLQGLVEKLKDVSELAKSRMTESLKMAERAAGSLERGDSKDAGEAAGKASGMFRELARNIEGLGAAETSQKIAAARNVSEELSQAERDFASAVDREQRDSASGSESPEKNGKRRPGQSTKPKDDENKSPGSGGQGSEDQENASGGSGTGSKDRADQAGNGGAAGEQRAEKLASRAERIAEAGKTLEDILQGITRSNEPGDREAVAGVQELLTQGKLAEAVKRLEAQAPALRAGKARETSAEARDMADRFEAGAQRLEGLHRAIVAPRIADLMKAEREAVELQEKLERLETQSQIGAWHREADELVEQLEKLDLAEEARDELVEAMKEAGWSAERLLGNWDWTLRSGHYGAPLVYHRSIKHVVSDLHSIIQELILGDLRGSADENTPPQYERLVERYYQILSSDK
jgi:hypothetical protein